MEQDCTCLPTLTSAKSFLAVARPYFEAFVYPRISHYFLSKSQELSFCFEAFTVILTYKSQSRYLSIPPSKTIIACICLFEVIPVYGLLGYVPAIRRFGTFGLQVCSFSNGHWLSTCFVGSSSYDSFIFYI